MDNKNIDTDHFLKHPEIKDLFDRTLQELIEESDRGAVIIGADIADSQLRKLLELFMSESLSNNKRSSLLDYPGPLCAFSAKADVALAFDFISTRTNNCLHALRKIRNKAAHSNLNFKLNDCSQLLREMYNLGDGVPVGINRWAIDVMFKIFSSNVLESMKDIEKEIGESPIKTPRDVLDYIADKPELLKPLEDRLPRFEFSLGLMLLCAILIHERDSVLKKACKTK